MQTKSKTYNYSDACSMWDYHENTGQLPDGLTKKEFNDLMAKFKIGRDNWDDEDLDPAGGHGLSSHI